MSLIPVENILGSIQNALLEATMTASGEFRERSNNESPERVERSKDLPFAKISGVDTNAADQVRVSFDVAGSSYNEDGKTYNTMVVLPGLLKTFKENPKPATVADAIKNTDVQVKCACNDFHYRYTYYLGQTGSLAGVGGEHEKYAIDNKPGERNPKNDKGPFCKHLIKVTSVFAWNIGNISSQLKTMDLDRKVEDVKKADDVNDGNIILEKETDEFAEAVIGTPEELRASLEKDESLTEEDREEVTEVLLDKEDGDIDLDEDEVVEEELSEPTLDEMNGIEPELEEGTEKIAGAYSLDKENDDIDLEEDEVETEILDSDDAAREVVELDKDEVDLSSDDDEIELDKDKA